MSNNYFAFKNFTVYHDRCAMKVGTDGVLLGAWANVENAKRILDVGTGTGLIAIMCAQRSLAYITGVEIDSIASEQADENRLLCPWKDRISIINDSFQHYASTVAGSYDVILCNPPFFRNSLKPRADRRTLARHDDNLSIESLFFHSKSLLKTDGFISIIIPADDVDLAVSTAHFQGLFPMRKMLVKPTESKKVSRCLIEFTQQVAADCLVSEMVMRIGNEFSPSYQQLTKEYYLNF